MSVQQQTRVAHPFAHFAKGWGIARSATVLLVAGLIFSVANAEAALCGITSVHDTAELNYPSIARAAHVEGSVILLAIFDHEGAVLNAKAIYGSTMLRGAALEYVKGWRVNESQGSRECPIVVSFRLTGAADRECSPNDQPTPPPSIERTDLQHVIAVRENMCLNVLRDSAGVVIRHKHFLLF